MATLAPQNFLSTLLAWIYKSTPAAVKTEHSSRTSYKLFPTSTSN